MRNAGYLIGDDVVAPNAQDLQQTLARAHANHVRPKCLCSPARPEMYVAKFNDYLVKRMPGTGPLHDPRCDAYESALSESGLGEVLGDAIEERESGEDLLHLNFTLSRHPAQSGQERTASQSSSVSVSRKRLSLRAFLHYLWHKAGLNRWGPDDSGAPSRSWPLVRARLMIATDACYANGSPLSSRLYLPEPFDRDKIDEIAARRDEALAGLISDQHDGGTEMMIVIGEFKALSATSVGHKIVLKHMANRPLLIDAKAGTRLLSTFSEEMTAQAVDDTVRLVGAFVIFARQEGMYEVAHATTMATHRQWIPFDYNAEKLLLEKLIQAQRHFIKPLRYQSKVGCIYPNFILLDAGAEEVPMDILSPTLPENDKADKVKGLEARPPGAWLWNTAQPSKAPALPWIPTMRNANGNERRNAGAKRSGGVKKTSGEKRNGANARSAKTGSVVNGTSVIIAREKNANGENARTASVGNEKIGTAAIAKSALVASLRHYECGFDDTLCGGLDGTRQTLKGSGNRSGLAAPGW